MSEYFRGLLFEIKETRKGAIRRIIPIDPTIKVEEAWGPGTHGAARVLGTGRFLVVDISNLANHRCALCELDAKGDLKILEQTPRTKFCALCETYGAKA
jgi:hypothetical protein